MSPFQVFSSVFNWVPARRSRIVGDRGAQFRSGIMRHSCGRGSFSFPSSESSPQPDARCGCGRGRGPGVGLRPGGDHVDLLGDDDVALVALRGLVVTCGGKEGRTNVGADTDRNRARTGAFCVEERRNLCMKLQSCCKYLHGSYTKVTMLEWR